MKKVRTFVFSTTVLFFSCILNGFSTDPQGLAGVSEIKAKCFSIAEDIMHDNIEIGFDTLRVLFADSGGLDIDYMEGKTIEMMKTVSEKYGQPSNVEFAKEEIIGSSLYRTTFLIKYSFSALRLRFTFYKGKDDLWYLIRFKWDDELSEVFDKN